jgi:hypothetical protein
MRILITNMHTITMTTNMHTRTIMESWCTITAMDTSTVTCRKAISRSAA